MPFDPGTVAATPAPVPAAPAQQAGVQYVGSQLQYVSPTGQILPVSAAPGASGTNTTSSTTPAPPAPATPPPPPPPPPVIPPVTKTVQNSFQNADGTITVVYTDGSTATTGTAKPATTTINPADTSAINSIGDILTSVGLNTLASTAYAQLKAGVPAAQIINDIRNSPDYTKRFPGMAALAARGNRITEADYIAKEQADIALLKQYNIPAGTFDTTDYLGKLISNNITAPDLQARLQAAQDSVNSLDPSVLKYAKDTYGLTSGSLSAWALDPTASLPVIQQQAKAMQIGGAAVESGYTGGLGANGELSTTQAEQLANANITQAAAVQGFNNLGQMGQYQTQLPGDTTQALTGQQLINAQFGLNAQDTLAVNKAKQQKLSEYQQGGAFASSATGARGLGVANAGS